MGSPSAATQGSFGPRLIDSFGPVLGASRLSRSDEQIIDPRRDAVRHDTVVPSDTVTESFDSYYRRDYRSLVGLAYVLSGSHWAAEDLAQEALTEAHRKWTTVGNYDDPAGWVRRVMVNKSTSRLRRLRTEAKGLVRFGNRPDELIAPTERSLEVWVAVRELPARQAQVIALFYWEDRSIADIAEILGFSTETAKTHLKRARATLARRLDSHRGDQS